MINHVLSECCHEAPDSELTFNDKTNRVEARCSHCLKFTKYFLRPTMDRKNLTHHTKESK